MSTEIKNQNTLFRFVSLRNPEKVKKQRIRTCFVFHNNLENSLFYANILRKGTETKWQNLENTASFFDAIKSEEELQNLTNDIFENSIWLAENRTNTDNTYLSQIAISKILDEKIENLLWDNLFYQVITQANFYIKEKIIQILTFNNLIRNYLDLNTQKGITDSLLDELKNAQVVLPTELFEENKELSIVVPPKENTEAVFSEAQINDKIQTAQSNIASLSTLKNEISTIEKSFLKEHKRNYDAELAKYNEGIQPLINEYQDQVITEKQKICERTENKETFETFCNQPNVKYPQLPKFIFEFPQPVDSKSLESKLSKESFTTLQRINAVENNETFQDIYDIIESEEKKENEIITNNFNFSNSAMLIGGILFNEKENRPFPTNVENKPAFVPEKFGVRNIGIADYKKVVSQVCCYDAGEVSHIENIMAKELRSKETERVHKSEVTTTTEQTNESENFHDTTSTERFEMQTEVAKILQENESFAANASVGYSGFGFSANIGANYATSTSKEESNRQAVNYAKDITQKATEKIVSRLRTEKVTKITDEFKEKNVHTFDNTKGINHISGVFRFVNSIYKNQIYNYGKRLMYEFMIPQPSKLHKLGMEQNKSNPNAVFLQKPTDPRIQFPDAN